MSESPLMLSVSGARGIVGESMTPEVAARFAAAFAAVAVESSGRHAPVMMLGRDSRTSGAELTRAVALGLVGAGCRVVDLGLVMTPTVGVMIQESGAAGGMVVTASHNPAQWNGLKCLNHAGAAPSQAIAERIIERFRSSGAHGGEPASAAPPVGNPPVAHDPSANTVHIERVLHALGPESVARIRAARFNVVLDSINGAGCAAGRALLEALGCEVHHLNGQPDGNFAHTPEPIAENLQALCAAVTRAQADIGFAQDPDGDRLAIVDERGTYIGEEYTLALCALCVLHRAQRSSAASPEASAPELPIVLAANLSTSRMIDDVALSFRGRGLHVEVRRTAVGEANVVEALMQARAGGANALLGGEGNGGVISPEVCWVRDSLISMALMLDLLANRETSRPFPPERGAGDDGASKLSFVVGSLPRYTMIKRKFDLSALGGRDAILPMLAKLKAEFSDRAHHPAARVSDIDGIRIDFEDGWVHLRPSNTEPIVRLIAEGMSKADCERTISQVRLIAGMCEA